jgi:hypothetical protein
VQAQPQTRALSKPRRHDTTKFPNAAAGDLWKTQKEMGKTVKTLQSQLEALIKAPSPAAPSSRIFCNEGKTELRQATSASRTPSWLPSDI